MRKKIISNAYTGEGAGTLPILSRKFLLVGNTKSLLPNSDVQATMISQIKGYQ